MTHCRAMGAVSFVRLGFKNRVLVREEKKMWRSDLPPKEVYTRVIGELLNCLGIVPSSSLIDTIQY